MRLRAREAASTVILEAAEEVASQRGLDATSTAAIAERAGVAVGTLYNYFPDRDALLAALFKLRRDELVPRIEAAASETKALPFEQRLRSYISGVARAFDAFRRFCRVAMSSDTSATKIRGRQSTVMDAVTSELAEILRPVVRGKAEEYARMIFGAFKALMQWRLEHDEMLEPCADLIVDTFLQGMATR
jgi:AcrR family transcriptional regulator